MDKLIVLICLSVISHISANYVPYHNHKVCSDSNEVFAHANVAEVTCDGRLPKPCFPVNECRCKLGYVRQDGRCIKPIECPVKCRYPNEEYTLARFSEMTCDDMNPIPINPINECRCKYGYVRHNGECIKPNACPVNYVYRDSKEGYVSTLFSEQLYNELEPQIEEYSDNNGYLINYKFKTSNEESVLPDFSEQLFDDLKPHIRECRSKNGRSFNYEDKNSNVEAVVIETNNDEIKPEECSCENKPPVKCKHPFEEYVYSEYSEPTCYDPIPRLSLPITNCRCKSGFVRHNSVCIPLDQCPLKCKDPNEEYKLVLMSEPTCDNRIPVPIAPVKRCQCKEGYVRYNDACIFPQKCPVICNGTNEEYVRATTTEPTCENPETLPIRHVKECRCIQGYLRHNGQCILPQECPCENDFEEYTTKPISSIKVCRSATGHVKHDDSDVMSDECPVICNDRNEEYVTVNTTEPTCENRNCTEIATVEECRCKQGYVRHNKVCILEENCPVICKDPYEDYTLALFSEPSCDDIVPRSITPIKECRCKSGYVRYNDNCIKTEDCPVKCNSTDEVYVKTSMSELTCEQRTSSEISSVEECRCREGLVRHQDKCIIPDNCPVTCSDPNESYIVTYFTEPTCDDPIPKSTTPVKECRCNQGFVRYGNACIKFNKCPPKCVCENAVFIRTNLSEITCQNQIPEPIPETSDCRCIDGYAKHNNKCIKLEECPVTCMKNEEYVLTSYTEPTCNDSIPDALPGKIQECRCVRGYARHNGECIPLEDCPPRCPDPNEEYILTTFSEPTCHTTIPKTIPPIKECRCKNGFLRHGNKCYRPDMCPVCSRCGSCGTV